jgi:prevent-host-death family protein
MDRVPIRELQQHASAVLRRVRAGETVGITDRGQLIAVVAPPSSLGGTAALVASGRVRTPTRQLDDLPAAVRVKRRTSDVLDDLRGER